jgi:hypothetical protein
MYLRARGVPQDYGDALQWYRRSAEQGSASGEVGLGGAYYYGYGVTPDYAESMRWYRRAADQGNAAGEAGLGYLYKRGDGVPQDDAEALRWYRKAADQGQKLAERELGGMYYYGQGVSPDLNEAVQWYRKAANQGEARAEYDLGFMYFYGKGVPRDRAEANRWFGKAADGGDENALRWVTLAYSTRTKGMLLFELAAGIFLLSLGWSVRLNHFAAPGSTSDRNKKATTLAGVLVIFYAGLKWYGYTHHLLRRLGRPMNAFTYFQWIVAVLTLAALVYMLRFDRQKSRAEGLAAEGDVETASE